MCATGIGITPCISTLVALRQTRRANVVWMVRDAELIEFYLESGCFAENAFTLIFYTGKPDMLRVKRSWLTPWIKIIGGRPKLAETIPAIIHASEDGAPLPDDLISKAKAMSANCSIWTTLLCFEETLALRADMSKSEIYQQAIIIRLKSFLRRNESLSAKDLSSLARQSLGDKFKDSTTKSCERSQGVSN